MSGDDLTGHLGTLADRFDFGEYEIQAYLAVLEYGQLTASEIAEETDIPQPRVYDTVRTLADNGFVEIRDSRPMQVIAIDPADAFATVRSALDDLVVDLENRYTAPARPTEAVSLVTSRQTILRYLEDVIGTAEYELLCSLTPDVLARFEDELSARRDDGVTVDLLLSPSADVPDANEYDYSRVATVTCTRRGRTTPVVAVADGQYSVYTTRSALQSGGDQYGVIFNRSELGFLVSGFLNTVVWPSATTLVEGDDDRPFPRRYATMRRCLRDIGGREETFFAAVTGRDVRTGDYRTVTGRITDVAVGPGSETTSFTLDTGSEILEVGGQAAALEDIEAYELVIDLNGPPEL